RSKKRKKANAHIFGPITPQWLLKCGSLNRNSNRLSMHLRAPTLDATHQSHIGLPFRCATFGDFRRNRRLPAFLSRMLEQQNWLQMSQVFSLSAHESLGGLAFQGFCMAIGLSSESPAIVYRISLGAFV